MAKTRSVSIVRSAPSVARPIIVQAPAPRRRAARKEKKKHHRRRSSSSEGTITQGQMISHATGGAIYGYIEKNFGAQIPTLPLVGRSGSIAIASYIAAKNGIRIASQVARAAATIAGYQFGTTGKVQGILASQV